MSTETKSSPPRGAAAILALAALAYALAQTAVHPLSLDSAFTKTFAIGVAVAAGIAACLIPRAASPHPAEAHPGRVPGQAKRST
jgi:hypothetical protein